MKNLINKYIEDCKDHELTGRNHYEWFIPLVLVIIAISMLFRTIKPFKKDVTKLIDLLRNK